MKTFATLAAAAAFSALSVAAPAQAGPWSNVSGAIQSVGPDSYTVTRIDSLDSDQAYGLQAQAAQQARQAVALEARAGVAGPGAVGGVVAGPVGGERPPPAR